MDIVRRKLCWSLLGLKGLIGLVSTKLTYVDNGCTILIKDYQDKTSTLNFVSILSRILENQAFIKSVNLL